MFFIKAIKFCFTGMFLQLAESSSWLRNDENQKQCIATSDKKSKDDSLSKASGCGNRVMMIMITTSTGAKVKINVEHLPSSPEKVKQN